MRPQMIPPAQIANWEPYVHFDKEFTVAECETIIHIAKGLRPITAAVGAVGAPIEDKSIRSSDVSWLEPSENTQWVFDKLANVCAKVRQNWYPFHINGFSEPLQLTHYKASESGHYETHRDFGGGPMSTRKLSLVMLLNDPAAFKGGELELFSTPGDDKAVKQLTQGTVIVFPAWELHRVLKVTEGDRWSLVCWMHGEPFV